MSKVKQDVIVVKGIKEVQVALKKLGVSPKKSRTLINKALRPAGNALARVMKFEYKKEFNNPSYIRKEGRTPTYKTIGVVTARRSRQPGLFVGPILRRTTPIRIKGKNSRNLPAMQIKGNAIQKARPNIFKKSYEKSKEIISSKAEKDMMKLLDKMIKQAGFK
tara:strand:+ start:1097 stop:1585 length:489 start_codon:yes stop_codon:yes gene_type:complete